MEILSALDDPTEKNEQQERSSMEKKEKKDLPWVEKYRPEKFSDIISHEDILRTIESFIQHKNLPHVLFYGPPGRDAFLLFRVA